MLSLWIFAHIGFNGLAKPIDAFSDMAHIGQAFFIFEDLALVHDEELGPHRHVTLHVRRYLLRKPGERGRLRGR